MTNRRTKTFLFASLIVAMILPFSSMNMADAATSDYKKQKKIDKLEIKLQKIADEIANIESKKADFAEKLLKAQEQGNQKHIQDIEEKIGNVEQKLVKLEAKHAKIQDKLDAKKGQIETTKHLINQVEKRISKLAVKIAQESKENSNKVEVLSEKLAKAENRLAKLNDRLDRQYAQENEDAIVTGYPIDEIGHAFEHAENFVSFDDAMHMIVDKKTLRSEGLTNSEIQIIVDFADIHNKMADAFYDQTDVDEKQSDDAIESLESGQFHKMFDPVESIVHTEHLTDDTQIVFVMYDQVSTPIKSAFGVESDTEITKVRHSTNSSPSACGSYGMSNPHPDIGVIDSESGFSSLYQAQHDLLRDRYHQVSSYATFSGEASRPYDYAKVVSSGAPGNCNSGQFRDQAIIDRSSYDYIVYGQEPNPEVLSYIWPGLWWPSYVQWWHAHF